MPTAHDVARYILSRRAMTAMKMQKLAYYSQAWYLAREGKPLFDEPVEAWVNGPVVRDLYDTHRGQFSLSRWPFGDANALSRPQRKIIDEILETYGQRSASWLSQLTHSEAPWRKAREGLPDTVRSSAVIDRELMREFYADAERRGRGPVAVTAVE
jgi:uncharacterized phage-associated protein